MPQLSPRGHWLADDWQAKSGRTNAKKLFDPMFSDVGKPQSTRATQASEPLTPKQRGQQAGPQSASDMVMALRQIQTRIGKGSPQLAKAVHIDVKAPQQAFSL